MIYDATTDSKLERLETLVRVYEVHLLDAHAGQAPPLFDTDDDCFVMSCRGCDYAYGIEGEEDDDFDLDERIVLASADCWS